MLGMDQMYKMALDPRLFPDARLLAVMQGKDQSLPMAVAMAAKQQRDRLTQASKGQQAQQGATQPTVKDQMVAQDLPPEHSGLAALPAENMHQMGEPQMMAGGGIVAFEDNKDQPVKSDMPSTPVSLTDEEKQALQNNAYLHRSRGLVEGAKSLVDSLTTVRNYDPLQKGSDLINGVVNGVQKWGQTPLDQQKAAFMAASNTSAPSQPPAAQAPAGNAPAGNAPAGNAPAVGTPAVGTPARAPISGIGNPPSAAPTPQPQQNQGISALAPTPRPDRFADMDESKAALDQKVADEKRAASGDFLMNMGLKMMTTVGPLGKAIGEGGLAGLPGLAASRKTINELEKNRRDFNLNIAKAREAKDSGDDQLAYHYKDLAQKVAYQSGTLAIEKIKAGAEVTKAGAYASMVGSKSDQAKEKMDASILKAASDIHDKNMASGTFGLKFAKMSTPERQQYFNDVRQQATALAGKDSGGNVGSGNGPRPVPQVGAVVDGHKFKGGDPNNKNNWE